ncbi:SDR family oxidoreductase [Nocardia sp. CA-136227]|uniref:SDR family oxidoreductase n=1 Tax=Nocardia sp. CA-136227 TaxID=3239979 RepID=UPI003D966325
MGCRPRRRLRSRPAGPPRSPRRRCRNPVPRRWIHPDGPSVGRSAGRPDGIRPCRRPPVPGSAVPSSMCGAIEALTRALAVELAPIRVNAVMPGVVRSPLWNFPDDLREQFYADSAAATPLRRIAEADDIARAFVFLIGQPHATAAVLTLDGGAVLA